MSAARKTSIELESVSKWFGDIVALNDVTLSLEPGLTALLGPNGAGKSTLIRLVCGLTGPSQGKITVLGENPRSNPSLGGRLALVPQQEAVPERLTGLKFVTLMAGLSGVANPERAASDAISQVELDPADGRGMKTYSKGMRQRIKVAQALVGDPEVIVLDEPLEGLDPRQRIHLIDLFARLGRDGRTVVVSSHVLEEVERFGSRVLMLAQGRLAAEGDFHAIRDLMDDRPHKIRIRSDKARALANALVDAHAVSQVNFGEDGVVVCDTTNVSAFRRQVAVLAKGIDARLTEVTPMDDDLESVFRYLVERR